jgi:hypothetical protein
MDECHRRVTEVMYSKILDAIMVGNDIISILEDSSIDLLISDNDVAILVQNGKIYAVDSIVEGCQFINFCTLRKLEREKVYDPVDKGRPEYTHIIAERK